MEWTASERVIFAVIMWVGIIVALSGVLAILALVAWLAWRLLA